MTDCPNGELRDLLPDYLHDRLDSSARGTVERHLAECTACRDELALLRDLRGTLQRAPRIDVAAVAAAIPAYRPAPRKHVAGGWRVAAAIAAIAVGGASLTLLGHKSNSRQVAVAPAPAAQVPASGGTGPQDAGSFSSPANGGTSSPPATSRSPEGLRPQSGSESASSVHGTPSVRSTLAPRGEELAMAGGTIADLSDGELSDLIGELDALDAVPSTDVESTESFLTGRHRGRHD